MNSRILRASYLATSALGVLMASAVHVHAADKEATIGDIIVTARRVEERLQDVPISITIINQQQLESRNILNAGDIAQFTPSLSMNNNFGQDNTTFSIRGFVQDIGTAPSVGVYFADVVAPRAGSIGFIQGDGAGPGNLFDLQNIQVLKGPQGTLQGRNTTGGSVLMVPQKPTHKYESYVEATLGDYSLFRIQGAANLPLTDTFRVRIGLDHTNQDGYLRNTSVDASGNTFGKKRFDNTDYTAFRASFVADLTPNLENYGIFSLTDSRNNGVLQKVIAAQTAADGSIGAAQAFGAFAAAQLYTQAAKGSGFYTAQSDLPNSYEHTQQWQFIDTTTWHASDHLTVKDIISYAQYESWQKAPLFGTDWSLGAPLPANDRLYIAAIEGAPGLPTAHQSTFTEEFQLQGRTGKLTWQGGVYYEHTDPLSTTAVENPTLLDCVGEPQLGFCANAIGGALDYHSSDTHTWDLGVYAQANYAITDKLTFTPGVRYTWDHNQDTSYYVGYRAFLFPGISNAGSFCGRYSDPFPSCTATLVQNSQAPTWLLDLDYKVLDDAMVYVKYSRGYRNGGVYPSAPVGFLTYKPEKVDTYEVGAKTSWKGAMPGLFDVSVFYNDFSNQQLQLGFYSPPPFNDPPTAGIGNVGKSRIYGLEAELNVMPFEGLNIDVSYAYLNTQIQQLGGGITPGALYGQYIALENMHVGSPLLFSPTHKLNASGTYTLPLDRSIGKITVGATYTYQSSEQANYSDGNLCWASAFNIHTVPVTYFTGANTSCSDLGVLKARGLLNVNASWTSFLGKPVDFAFYITNVTDEHYYNMLSGTLGYGLETASVGAPRMFGVRTKVHF